MAVNKVVYNGETLVDLTNDTVAPETLAEGVTAHDKSGAVIVGTMSAGGGGGADPVIKSLAITENGTYTAPDGVDGYSPVVVNVPIPDGYIQPSGELEVTENGTHDVTAYASVNVNVPTGTVEVWTLTMEDGTEITKEVVIA